MTLINYQLGAVLGCPHFWCSSHLKKHFRQISKTEHRHGVRGSPLCRGGRYSEEEVAGLPGQDAQAGTGTGQGTGRVSPTGVPTRTKTLALKRSRFSCSLNTWVHVLTLLPLSPFPPLPPSVEKKLPVSQEMIPRPKGGTICIAVSDLGPRTSAPAIWLPVQQ